MNGIGKILPVDGYKVLFKGNLQMDYAVSLTHLYQPLIGMKAVMLYQTLLHEIELQTSSLQTHHTLMSYLNLPLNEIYEARIKLEGIGLLKTYEHNQSDKRYYFYELKSPFSPNYFFDDAMFSELLFHHIGKDKFKRLRTHLYKEEPVQYGQDITKSFNSVFQTFHPALDEAYATIEKDQDESGPQISQIDFSWLEQMLHQRMIPIQNVLTIENKKIITQMTSLYDLASFEVEKAILWALTADNLLDLGEFKSACHDLFKSKHHNVPIQLTSKVTESAKSQPIKKPLTKEEQLIRQLETISPKQLLEDYSSGNQASEQDLKMISDVMTSQGLPMPVMNVLVHYVLLQSNMKLSKSYLEKIASHWSRANLKTAREAMNFAKKEINKFRQKPTKKTHYKRTNSREVVPDWFKDRKKQPKKMKHLNDPQLEKERDELKALLSQFSDHHQK